MSKLKTEGLWGKILTANRVLSKSTSGGLQVQRQSDTIGLIIYFVSQGIIKYILHAVMLQRKIRKLYS